MKSKVNAIHFVGIGGIGMSSLAQFLLAKDYIVSGSDISRSSLTKKLASKGCTIFTKHDSKNIDNQTTFQFDSNHIISCDALCESQQRIIMGKGDGAVL